MGSSYYTNPVVFLLETLSFLYILAVMLRFLLQWVDAEYYNPISQFLVKITQPPLRILRKFIPSIGRIDTASLILLIVLQILAGLAIFTLQGASIKAGGLFFWAVHELTALLINIFMFGIIIRAILSWVNPGSYSSAASLLYGLTEPLLRLGRRIISPISGIDLSPLFILFGLVLTKMLLLPPVKYMMTLLS